MLVQSNISKSTSELLVQYGIDFSNIEALIKDSKIHLYFPNFYRVSEIVENSA